MMCESQPSELLHCDYCKQQIKNEEEYLWCETFAIHKLCPPVALPEEEPLIAMERSRKAKQQVYDWFLEFSKQLKHNQLIGVVVSSGETLEIWYPSVCARIILTPADLMSSPSEVAGRIKRDIWGEKALAS